MESNEWKNQNFYIKTVKEIFDLEPNHFVKLSLIDFLKNNLRTNDSELEKNFKNFSASKALKEDLKHMLAKLSKFRNNYLEECQGVEKDLKEFLTEIKLENNFLWEPADYLLRLPSIKNLTRNAAGKLIEIVKNLRCKNKLESFFKETCESSEIDQAQLEKESREINKKYNLSTLIEQIYKKKPKEKPANVQTVTNSGSNNPENNRLTDDSFNLAYMPTNDDFIINNGSPNSNNNRNFLHFENGNNTFNKNVISTINANSNSHINQPNGLIVINNNFNDNIINLNGNHNNYNSNDYNDYNNNNVQITENNIITENSNPDTLSIAEKYEKIYEIKEFLIQTLMLESNQGSLYEFLIKKLLSTERLCFENKSIQKEISKRERGNLILESIEELSNILLSLALKANKLKILTETVNEANYARFTNIATGIKTARLISLLTQGKQITDEMKEKIIIAFFGNTGSGKSTTVNYFAGVPLMKSQNNFGDEIIKIINEAKFQGNSAKIGHSLGTSETLYAQSYKIIEDAYDEETIPKQNVKDLFLCDNPGFGDTRGTDYEMCTNLSIDQAILNCKKLQAAVLVLPYSVFSLDRGNFIFEAIWNLQERFPDLHDMRSDTFQSFFIAMTKFQSEANKESFEERLAAHIAEESKNKAEFEKYNDRESNETQNKRLHLFNCLLNLLRSGRILFVNPEDLAQREQDLLNMLETNGIRKSKYNRILKGSQAKAFVSEISKTADCWCEKILKEFVIVLPKEIEALNNQFHLNEKKMEALKIKIFETKNDYCDPKKLKISAFTLWNDLLEKDLSKTYMQVRSLRNNSNSVILSCNNYRNNNEIKEIQTKIALLAQTLLEKKIKLTEAKKRLEKTQIKLQAAEQEFAEQIENLEKISTGETLKTLHNVKFLYGQEINFSSWESGERENCLSEISEAGKFGINKIVFAGFCKIDFWISQKIKRDYRFVPENLNLTNEQELNDYLNSKFCKTQVELHRAKITGIKADSAGKELVIQYKLFFDVCDDLPFISVKHLISNSLYNEEFISVKSLDIEVFRGNVSRVKMNVVEIGLEIMAIKSEIDAKENERAQLEKFCKENEKAISAKNQKKENLKKIKDLNLELNKLNNQIEQISRERLDLKNENENLKNKKFEKFIELKKLSLLILDQMEKNIPQSLFEFIKIANDIDSQVIEIQNGYERKNLLNQREKECFENFKNFYLEVQKDLRAKALEISGLKYI